MSTNRYQADRRFNADLAKGEAERVVRFDVMVRCLAASAQPVRDEFCRLGFWWRRCVDPEVRPLSDFSMPEFETLVASWGHPTVHARKLLRRYYMGSGAIAWEQLELPKGFRGRVAALGLATCTVAARQEDPDGTVKLLLRLADGQTVETVLMADGRSVRAAGCLSTQVGCAMGCDFCATAQGGLVRNLTAGEIVEQFFHLRREAARVGKELRTIVVMGMGEPLANLVAVIPAAHRIGWGELGAVGFAQITVSTVGLVPKIDELAASGVPVALALSLHAPDDATRQRLLPTARRYGIEEVLAAADRYQETTGRIVNIQYCLLRGVNDSPEQARQLATLLEKRRMHVNLLTYNPTGPGLSGVAYEPPPRETVGVFLDELHARGIVAHFRRPRGAVIDGACGQLRARAGE